MRTDSDEFAHGIVRGYCPMGCGETLFVGSGGYLTCGVIGCADPSAVSLKVLADRDLMEHVLAADKLRNAIIDAEITKAVSGGGDQ